MPWPNCWAQPAGPEAQLCNARQLAAATRARDAIAEAMKARQAGFGLDATGICLTDALQALCDLTGEDASDATIEKYLRRFVWVNDRGKTYG